jgi:hypothetical protein
VNILASSLPPARDRVQFVKWLAIAAVVLFAFLPTAALADNPPGCQPGAGCPSPESSGGGSTHPGPTFMIVAASRFQVGLTSDVIVNADGSAPASYDFCFIRAGVRTCRQHATSDWMITYTPQQVDGSGGIQYLSIRVGGIVYARARASITVS